MDRDLSNSVRQCVAAYRRGLLGQNEFVHRLLDTLAESDSSDEITEAFFHVPDAVIPLLRNELHRIAEADYFLKSFSTGDPRSKGEIDADALARQPTLRRICGVIRPLVLSRAAR